MTHKAAEEYKNASLFHFIVMRKPSILSIIRTYALKHNVLLLKFQNESSIQCCGSSQPFHVARFEHMYCGFRILHYTDCTDHWQRQFHGEYGWRFDVRIITIHGEKDGLYFSPTEHCHETNYWTASQRKQRNCEWFEDRKEGGPTLQAEWNHASPSKRNLFHLSGSHTSRNLISLYSALSQSFRQHLERTSCWQS